MSVINLLDEVRCERTLQEHFEACDYAALQLESLATNEEALSAIVASCESNSFESVSIPLEDMFGHVFNQEQQRQAMSLEVIKEALEQIWQAIKNVIGRLVRATKDFFYNLLRGTKGILKKIQALREKSDSVDTAGLAPPTQPIVVTGGSRLHMGGTIDAKQLAEGIDSDVLMLSQVKNVYLEGASNLVNQLDDLTDRIMKVDDRSADVLQKDIRALSTHPSQVSVDVDGIMRRHRNLELPGGKRVEVELTQYTPRGIPKDMPNLTVTDFQKRVSYKERDKVPVPELDAISTLLDRTEEMVNSMIESNERADNLAKRYERIVERAEDLFDRQSMMYKLKTFMHEHTVELLMRFYQMGMPTAIHRVSKYEFSVARATLAYVNDCLSSYETPR